MATQAKPRTRNEQPLAVADNPDALLKLATFQAIAGMGRTKVYSEIKAGKLKVVRVGCRFTRVTGRESKRYLQSIGKEV